MSETLRTGSPDEWWHSFPRVGMKRMAPPRTGNAPEPAGATAPENGMSRLQSKKISEDKTRARTLARAQAVAEKLTATEQVAQRY